MRLLAEKQLVVVTGKGGVGKTTVAAALASALSRERAVTLAEMDPRESAHELFGVPPSGGERVQVRRNLELVNIRPDRVVNEVVRSRLKSGWLARHLFGSSIYRHFVDGAPGLKELAVLKKAFDLASLEDRCVVLDSPATGHGLSLLRAPRLVADAISTGPVAEVTGEVAGWLQSAAVGVVLVAMAEELPVTETLEATARLRDDVGKKPSLVAVNAIYPPYPESLGDHLDTSGEAQALWRERRRLNERELERLETGLDDVAPTIEIPLFPIDGGQDLAARVARLLLEELTAEKREVHD